MLPWSAKTSAIEDRLLKVIGTDLSGAQTTRRRRALRPCNLERSLWKPVQNAPRRLVTNSPLHNYNSKPARHRAMPYAFSAPCVRFMRAPRVSLRVPDRRFAAWRVVPRRACVAATAAAVQSGMGVVNVGESALREGIKAVAVGKRGVKPVPVELVPRIVEELAVAEASAFDSVECQDLFLLRASFMGSLFVKKELSRLEMDVLSRASNDRIGVFAQGRVRQVDELRCSAGELLAYVSVGESTGTLALAPFALRLLNGESLSLEDSDELGRILYAAGNNDSSTLPIKTLIAHVMRIRHESHEEISGLAMAAASTLSASFSAVPAVTSTVYAHIAEPYDGAVTWDLLTPLLCRHLRMQHGLHPVMATGASSGPKYGPNLHDVAVALGMKCSRDAAEVATRAGCDEFGAVVNQSDASAGMSAWVHPRRVILKRPSIATTEKYVDACPGGASLFISSAFHSAYIDKMADAAEATGYPAYIIVGKGMEGTTGLGIGERRTSTLLTGWVEDGGYARATVEYSAAEAGVYSGNEGEPEKGSAGAERTARRIRAYVANGSSGDMNFDARVAVTLGAFDKAMLLVAPTLQKQHN